MKVVGIVTDGEGLDSKQMDRTPERWSVLGYLPYPGSLNLRVSEEDYAAVADIRSVVGPNMAGVGVAYYRPVRLGWIDGHAKLSRSSLDLISILAPVCLRDALGILNGGHVTVELA